MGFNELNSVEHFIINQFPLDSGKQTISKMKMVKYWI